MSGIIDINLDDNLIESIDQLKNLEALRNLKSLKFKNKERNTDNPFWKLCKNYSQDIKALLPRLQNLDGEDILLIQREEEKGVEYSTKQQEITNIMVEPVEKSKILKSQLFHKETTDDEKDKLITKLYEQLHKNKKS